MPGAQVHARLPPRLAVSGSERGTGRKISNEAFNFDDLSTCISTSRNTPARELRFPTSSAEG